MEIPAVKMWVDLKHGVQHVEDDVLDVVRQLKEMSDGRVRVYYNEQANEFNIVEHCLDGVERLVFNAKELDARVVERLRRADHWDASTPDRGYSRPEGSDFLDDVDAFNEALEREIKAGHMDKIGDAAEQLARALDIGVGVQSSIHVKKDIKG